MNQEHLASWCLERVRSLNAVDPTAWYPVYGWPLPDGSIVGLALERFGNAGTKRQHAQLGKALWRLCLDGELQAARFRRRGDGIGLVAPALEQGDAVRSQLAKTTSGGNRAWNAEYAVRLAREARRSTPA